MFADIAISAPGRNHNRGFGELAVDTGRNSDRSGHVVLILALHALTLVDPQIGVNRVVLFRKVSRAAWR